MRPITDGDREKAATIVAHFVQLVDADLRGDERRACRAAQTLERDGVRITLIRREASASAS